MEGVPVKNTHKTRKKTHKKPEKENSVKIYDDTEKSPEGAQGVNTPADDLEVLPPDLFQTILSIFENFCKDYNIESMEKAAQSQFSAACMLVGQYMKKNKILFDQKRSAERGGRGVYDPVKVAACIDLWAHFCGIYKKTPFIFDFERFSGVSETWLYNLAGNNLTSSNGEILKKAQKMQESGIASTLADGRVNPTGLIYLTKARMGWSDAPGMIQTKEEKQAAADGLPVFDGDKLLKLPKNQ